MEEKTTMTAVDIERGGGAGGRFPWKKQVYVFFCWIFAAFGGLMFGYDIGISGGVTAMDDFLIQFFPSVYHRKLHAREDNYCKYNDQLLQLFTSSLYIAAIFSSFAASVVCKKFGRKRTILAASLVFLLGAGLSSGAQNLPMLIIGRILLGIGVGFGNEAVPLFLSEIAPVHQRGAVNILFQLLVTVGVLFANLVNYGTAKLHPYGYRVSLGLAGLPALFLFFGSLIITDTPTSLIERGKEDEGYQALENIRDLSDVDFEFKQIQSACEVARQVKTPFWNVFKRPSRPPLVIGILMQVFQQFTGINAIMFYAPVAIGLILLLKLTAAGSLSKLLAGIVVGLVCLYVMSFAWSWGPLGWLIPSETFPLETRTYGFAFAVSSNMLCTFIIAQAFLSMMCTMQAYIFFFFAGCILVMGLFVWKLLPETKNVPVDLMFEEVWKKHPFWSRFME
ncbi:sugar transporter, putative [Ricinus communis]|uniref:Sugar transporter, putative n=1 Tax=Ricinus communis TaxID=3988 RepID=B9SW15_RICCO|nr:sugar transporter, putative [Ricinus communis]